MSYTVAIRCREITSCYRIGSGFQPFHRLLNEYVLGGRHNGTQGKTVGCKLNGKCNDEMFQLMESIVILKMDLQRVGSYSLTQNLANAKRETK